MRRAIALNLAMGFIDGFAQCYLLFLFVQVKCLVVCYPYPPSYNLVGIGSILFIFVLKSIIRLPPLLHSFPAFVLRKVLRTGEMKPNYKNGA